MAPSIPVKRDESYIVTWGWFEGNSTELKEPTKKANVSWTCASESRLVIFGTRFLALGPHDIVDHRVPCIASFFEDDVGMAYHRCIFGKIGLCHQPFAKFLASLTAAIAAVLILSRIKMKGANLFSTAVMLVMCIEQQQSNQISVQAFTVVTIAKCVARPSLAIGSYLDSLSSGGRDDDDSRENQAGPPPPQPKSISVNSYLDSLSNSNNRGGPTSYGDISYGPGGINPSSWTASQTADGYLSNIGGAQGAASSPWDSGKSPSPWTPPNNAAKFAPVPSDNQASKDQGLLFFADVLSSQQNQQQPELPTEFPPRNADLQNQAIGGSNGQGPLPTSGEPQSLPQPFDPRIADTPPAKYKSLYEDIEEDVGVIRSQSQDYAPPQQQQRPAMPIPQTPQQFPNVPQDFAQPPMHEPAASVEEPRNPEKYESTRQPGEVITSAPFPSPPSSSGPPSWVVQVTQESNAMPVQPTPEPEEVPTGPQFRSDSGVDSTDIGYSSVPSPTFRQQPAPAPAKTEDVVKLAPQSEQQVVEYKSGSPAVHDQQRELDSAFLRLASALAKTSSPSGGQVGAVLVSVEGEILGEGGNEDAVLEAMQQSGFRFVPPRNGEGIGVTPPRSVDPRTMTLYTTSQPEDIRISKAIRNSCIGRVVVMGD